MAVDPDHFWSRVDRSGGPDACWPWLGARLPLRRDRSGGGYGSVRVGDRQVGTHRVAYELAFGPIPPGMLVRHTCDNPPCCNPGHLLTGTHADNRRDRAQRGRNGDCRPRNPANGERAAAAKLSVEDVRDIRGSTGSTISDLARRYGVSRPTIRAVLSGASWKQVAL